MRRTGWHISFVPSAEVTAFIQSPHRPAKPGRHRDACLTKGLSKKVENRAHSVALFAMYCNFVRVHKTLRVTRATAADVTKRLWEMSDIVDVLEAYEAKAAN